MQTQTKTRITETQTITKDTITIKTIDTKIVAISKATDITTISEHQTNNKTETTQSNNHVDIVTEEITSQGIVKPVSTVEEWDICLANVEHHDKIKTIENKNRKLTKTREITMKTATENPLSKKIL